MSKEEAQRKQTSKAGDQDMSSEGNILEYLEYYFRIDKVKRKSRLLTILIFLSQ